MRGVKTPLFGVSVIGAGVLVLGVSFGSFAGCGYGPDANGGSGPGGGTTGTASSSSGGTTASGSSSSSSTSSSSSSATGTGGGSAGCASLPLCDDFEADTAGSPPSAAIWTILNVHGCSGSSAYAITVDTAQAHSGSKSVRVDGGDSCGPMMINTTAFPALTGDVYGRFFVYLTGMTPFDHTVLMTLGLVAGATSPGMSLDQSKNLSLAPEQAGSANVLMWQTTDGDILPDKNAAGGATSTYPAAGTWTCIEFHTSPAGALSGWVNGAAVAGLTFVPGTTARTQGVNDQWTPPSSFAPQSLGLGWIVFSGPATTLWIDDEALGSARIGCQ
jgi:hypothetical protein